MLVDISGLPKHAVVAALWNATHRQSVFDHKTCMSETRAREVAEFMMAGTLPDDRLDWVDARSMKVDLRGDFFDPSLWDRDNGGEGAAARVIATLRQNLGVPEHAKQQKVSEVDGGATPQVHGDSPGQSGQPAQEARSGQEILPEGGSDRAAS